MTRRIKVINPPRARLAATRRTLARSVRDAVESHGANLAGYALVTWDMRGECACSFHCADGMVGSSLVPVLVHDVLSRRISTDAAIVAVCGPEPGDAS